MDEETYPLSVAIQRHNEKIAFHVVTMACHNVILGIHWLRLHNPNVDWIKRVLKFERCSCVAAIQSEHRRRSTADEKWSRKSTARHERAASYEDDLKESDLIYTDVGQLDHEVRFSENNYAAPEILGAKGKMGESSDEVPAVYGEWKVLFQEEEPAIALPKHQLGDH